MIGRRDFILGGGAVTAGLVVAGGGRLAAAQTAYPATIDVLRKSRISEANAYRHYVAFAKQANAEGYIGIAYMFTALATAELIHGQNFEKLLARLGIEASAPAQSPVRIGNTRENLITASADELDSVRIFYPNILRQLQPEGFADATAMTRYAWESEKQHLDILLSIQRWTPNHFEAVAKKIEKETGQYFVCQICGATAVAIPPMKCPICNFLSENYRKIESAI